MFTCPFYWGEEGVESFTGPVFTFDLVLIELSLPVSLFLGNVAVRAGRGILASFLVIFGSFCFIFFFTLNSIFIGTGLSVRRRSLDPVATHPWKVTLKYEDTEGLKRHVTTRRMLR